MATETIRLYIDSDEDALSWALELARHDRETSGPEDCEQVKSGVWTREEAEAFNLADSLEECFPERFELPIAGEGLLSSLLENAIDGVDWNELARHYLGKLDDGA